MYSKIHIRSQSFFVKTSHPSLLALTYRQPTYRVNPLGEHSPNIAVLLNTKSNNHVYSNITFSLIHPAMPSIRRVMIFSLTLTDKYTTTARPTWAMERYSAKTGFLSSTNTIPTALRTRTIPLFATFLFFSNDVKENRSSIVERQLFLRTIGETKYILTAGRESTTSDHEIWNTSRRDVGS